MTYTFANIRFFGLLGIRFAQKAGDEYLLNPTLFICAVIICSLIAYLLGSLNFAIIISRLKYHDDIRKYGSKNAGMTNMIRTYGTAAGVCTFLGDILKAVISVYIAWFAVGEAAAYISGFFCILGHAFPVWYHFKGGKGVAVTAAMILCLEPIVFLVLLVIFIIVVAVTRYISLGSIMSVLMYPLVLRAFYPHTHPQGSMLFGLIMLCSVLTALLVVFLHRENMSRLLNHTENKFSFRKKGTQNSEDKNQDNK